LAEPASPCWFTARCAGPGKLLRHRVPATRVGDARLEAFFEDIPSGLGRQYHSERRAGEAERRAKARTGRLEKGAAVADIPRNILEIGLRDHPPPAIAVENDQVEFVELNIEQFADREGDQRQFANWRAVLLFGWPQDREMDEVDRGIGFKD